MNIAGRTCLRRVDISVGVEPNDAQFFCALTDAGQGADGNAVITAENEREASQIELLGDSLAEGDIDPLDFFQIVHADAW